jgi:lipoprotein-releasing system ATP-binding protein
MEILKAIALKKSYGTLEVLKGVNMEVKKGEIVAIVGSSGAGKSTLLHVIGTLDKPDEGEIILANQSLNSISGNQLASFRNKHIGFVFQFHHLLPEFTALENVLMPAMICKTPLKVATENAMQLLHELGLKDRIHHKPSQLSGGEAQRVAVARSLINNPTIICADEPSGNLDSTNAKELHQLFFDLRATRAITFIIVTHNDQLAQMADRILVMKDGLIVNE